MAVRVSAESGFEPGYMLKGQAEQAASERTAGGYYINAAQAGEAPGRWFGRGAEALGFGEGQVVEAVPFLAVYQQVHPVTGERMGRAPGGYAKTKGRIPVTVATLEWFGSCDGARSAGSGATDC